MVKLVGCFYIFLCVLSIYLHPSYATTSYNVLRFGANGNGVTDSTQAFIKAWAAACSTTGSANIYVPRGRYLLGPVAFRGGCRSPDITIRIDGALVAPGDYRVLAQANNWLSFEEVDGVSIVGGALDARGSALWACKAAGNNCPIGARTLSFTNSKHIKISGVLSINSQIFHIAINGCKKVRVEGVKIIASGDSPNTDGIHVELSRDVKITSSSIKTGDDCISIGPGTKNLWIESISCGPGHGISIGSLARDQSEKGVQNVTVKNVFFRGTQNGFRIKSWARPSNGYVHGVRFVGAIMQNVQNPILIDQHYCPHNFDCPGQVSGVKIIDVTYQNIRGTSATPVAINFDCSTKYPCQGIKLQNVNLIYMNQPAQSSCKNVVGRTLGFVEPESCL